MSFEEESGNGEARVRVARDSNVNHGAEKCMVKQKATKRRDYLGNRNVRRKTGEFREIYSKVAR